MYINVATFSGHWGFSFHDQRFASGSIPCYSYPPQMLGPGWVLEGPCPIFRCYWLVSGDAHRTTYCSRPTTTKRKHTSFWWLRWFGILGIFKKHPTNWRLGTISSKLLGFGTLYQNNKSFCPIWLSSSGLVASFLVKQQGGIYLWLGSRDREAASAQYVGNSPLGKKQRRAVEWFPQKVNVAFHLLSWGCLFLLLLGLIWLCFAWLIAALVLKATLIGAVGNKKDSLWPARPKNPLDGEIVAVQGEFICDCCLLLEELPFLVSWAAFLVFVSFCDLMM